MVPMIHSAVLIHLRDRLSDKLTFDPNKIADYDGPVDDIITFAVGANKSGNLKRVVEKWIESYLNREITCLGLQLHVCNDRRYGYIIVPLDETEKDTDHLLNLKLHVTGTLANFSVRLYP